MKDNWEKTRDKLVDELMDCNHPDDFFHQMNKMSESWIFACIKNKGVKNEI